MASYRPVTAALRVLDVLEAVNRLQRARVREIGKLTGLNGPTVVRMLETLEFAGFVYRDAEAGDYSATSKTFALSRGYDLVRELQLLTQPVLQDLQAKVAWPSDAAIFDGSAMVVVATTRRAGQLFSDLRPGYRAPVFATSLGRAFIAWADSSDCERALIAARRSSMTSTNSIEEEKELAKLLAGIRAQGYAAMEHGSGVASLAIPVLDRELAIGAVNVLYLPSALERDAAVETLLPPLRETAGALASAILSQQAATKGANLRSGDPTIAI